MYLLSVCLGCTPQQVSILDLHYQGIEKSEKQRPVKVAIMGAQFTGTNVYAKMMSSPLVQLASTKGSLPYEMSLQSTYFNKYAPRIKDSLTSDIESLLRDKGFNVAHRYDSFDEIPYEARKETELLIIPTFDFGPNVANSPTTMPFIGVINKGALQLIGRMEIAIVEPLSREKLIIKKLDVKSTSYNYSSDAEGINALVDLINATYPDILKTASILLDADEIEASVKSSHEIKSKKVF